MDIIAGYEMASQFVLKEMVTLTIEEKLNKEALANAIVSVIASKQYGFEGFLAGLVAEAAMLVMPKNTNNFEV